MSIIGYHLVIKLQDGRVIARTEEQRREAACRVLAICSRFNLLVFHLVDSHLHLELIEPLAVAMQVARRIEYSLSRVLRLPVPFSQAYAEPIRNQGYLYRAFDYILRQQSRHDLHWDPYFDASNLSDLLGLRTVGSYTLGHVRAYLPRIHRPNLLTHLGVPTIEAADGPMELLGEATLAAAGLVGMAPLSHRARAAITAAAHIAESQLTRDQLGKIFTVSPRTVQRYRKQQADPSLVEAIRRQLFLRSLKRPGDDHEGSANTGSGP